MAEEIGALRAVLALESAAFDKGVASARRQLTGLGGGFQKAGGQVVQFGSRMRDIDRASRAGSGGLQNIGFQVQDFAVQVGAGTSASQALAQQLPQLLSGFGMLGIALGTASAILIPLASVIFSTGETAKTSGEAVTDLAAAVNTYIAAADAARVPTDQLVEKYGSLSVAAREALAATEAKALVDAMSATDAAIAAVVSSMTSLRDRVVMSDDGFSRTVETIRVLNDNFGMTEAQVDALRNALSNLDAAEGLEAQAEAARQVSAALLDTYGSVEAMPVPLQAAYGEMAGIVLQAGEIKGAMEEVAAPIATAIDLTSRLESAASGLAGYFSAADGAVAGLAKTLAAAATNAWALAQARAAADLLATRQQQIAAGGMTYSGRGGDPRTSNRLGVGEFKFTTTATGGGGGNAAQKQSNDLQREAAQVFEKTRTEAEKYATEVDNLNRLLAAGAIDQDTFTRAVEDLDESAGTLADTLETQLTSAVDSLSNSFGDFIVNGFSDFKGFAEGIVNVFKGAISDMISTAIANPIKLAISGGAAAVTPAVGGAVAGAGAGVAGGAAAGAAGFLGTAWTGLSSGFMTSVYGGLGGTVGAVSGGLAAGGVQGFATAIGALAAPIAAIIAVFSFFKKKTTQLDGGLKITADNVGVLVEEFKVIQTKRFWGLSKKTKTELNQAASDLSDPIVAAVSTIQANALAMAETIGLGADAFSSFAYNVSLSLKDMDAEQAQAAVEAELAKLGDAFANAALGWFEETQGILQAGETWSQALERLANSLTTVNGTMGYLGKALFDISVSGAKAASELIGFFGTLENFNAAQSAYLNAFYSDQERLNLALADMGKTFAALGVEVPASNAAFRALVDAQDLTQSSGRAMYAALIQIAPAFDQVGKATEELATAAATAAAAITAQNAELISQARGNLDRAIAAEGEALKARLDVAQDAFNESKSVVDGLRKSLRGLRQEDRLLASRRSAQGVLAGSLAGGRITDSDAFRDALDVVAEPSEGLFDNFTDYQRDFLLTANTIAALDRKAGAQLSTDELTLQSIDMQLEQLQIIANSFSEQITAIMSVEEAVRALGALGVSAGGATGSSGSSEPELGVVEKAYIDVLGRAGDEAGLKFWNGLLASGAVPLANFLGEFRKGAVANGEVPRFAAGGLHMGGWRIVGENGPEAEFTPPSRIVSSGQTRSIMGGELTTMKEEMKAYLREVVRNTGSTARTLDKFDGDGLPAERAA